MHPLKLISLTLATTNVKAQDLLSVIGGDNELSTLFKLLNSVKDFTSFLTTKGDVTFLAPTDAAFQALKQSSPEGTAISSGDNRGTVSLLAYHAIGHKIQSTDITPLPQYVQTLLMPGNTIGEDLAGLVPGGQYVGFQSVNGKLLVKSGLGKNCTIIKNNIPAGSVVIHKIDSVLTLPETLSATLKSLGLGSFHKLLDVSGLATVADYTGPSTIFVPKDAALATVMTGLTVDVAKSLVKNHISPGLAIFTPPPFDLPNMETWGGLSVKFVASGGTYRVEASEVILRDVIVLSGVVQVIDK